MHLGPAEPWEVLHMNAQHWQLYVQTQTDSTVHSYDKSGQLCTSTHSSGLLHERRSPPHHQSPDPSIHCKASVTGTIPPNTQPYPTPTSYADGLPTSAAVHLTTLRNHHPCQVQADPAILSAAVRGQLSRVGCTAAATVGDVITAK